MGLPLSSLHAPDDAAGHQIRPTDGRGNAILPARVAEDLVLQEIQSLMDATAELSTAIQQHFQNEQVSPHAAGDLCRRLRMIQDRLSDLYDRADHIVIHTRHRS